MPTQIRTAPSVEALMKASDARVLPDEYLLRTARWEVATGRSWIRAELLDSEGSGRINLMDLRVIDRRLEESIRPSETSMPPTLISRSSTPLFPQELALGTSSPPSTDQKRKTHGKQKKAAPLRCE